MNQQAGALSRAVKVDAEGDRMLAALDESQTLTRNQKRIVVAAAVSTALEYSDYFIIGFVMAFIVKPWELTFGETATVLMSSGIGATIGAFFWGNLADRIGRRPVLLATVVVFSLATGALALTPDRNWLYLAGFRAMVGFGVGGLYSVQLPLVQEFMPARRRGEMAGLVTSFVSVGIVTGELAGAFLTPLIGWRGLFAVGLLPGFLALGLLLWVPESPFWLVSQGRAEDLIRVNLISPDAIAGERVEEIIRAQAGVTGRSEVEIRSEIEARAPLRTMVGSADVVELALFLSSSAADKITGQDINISAGAVMY